MESDRTCCEKFAKVFLMCINILIVIVGGVILGFGVYWATSETGFYKALFSHDIFNVPNISIAIGTLLLLIGLSGFIGACCEVLFLLKLYMGFLILILLTEVILAVGCIAMRSQVEKAASEKALDYMALYKDESQDEKLIFTKTLDMLQENFKCCGVNGPGDWATQNAMFSKNDDEYVPDSCCKDNTADCGQKDWRKNEDDFYITGCQTQMRQTIGANMLVFGLVTGAIIILQVAILIMAMSFKTSVEDEKYLTI